MEFSNRLYELRKQKGLSQEELAGKLNVTRQTISKWEIGDSTPDMEKLIAISELFGISLDELMLGKKSSGESFKKSSEETSGIKKFLTEENKANAGKFLKIAGIIAGILVAIDFISMIVYFGINGIPK